MKITSALVVASGLCVAQPAAAQLRTAPSFGLGAFVGANALGLEAEYRPIDRLALSVRAAGLPVPDYATALAGVRLDVLAGRYARPYLLLGVAGAECPTVEANGSAACRDAGWRAGWAVLAGGELSVSEASRFSMALELGRLQVLHEPPERRLSGLLVNAALRVRIPM